MKKVLMAVLMLCLLCACHSQEVMFNLEKEGELYNYNEVISFYYPRDWNLVKDDVKLSLDIVNTSKKEAFYFDAFDIQGSNTHSEQMCLYEAKLKTIGVEIESSVEDTLDSGQKCYVVYGKVNSDSSYFCEVIAFTNSKQYIYSYIASSEVFEENNDTMIYFLKSLVVNEAMKSAI